MLKIKNNFNLKELEKFGYFVSHVAVFPKKIVKQVSDEYIIEIGIEEPSRNIWTNKDWKDSRILSLHHCKILEPHCKNKILLEPEIEEHLYYETDYGTYENSKIEPYIDDLIKADLVEKVDDNNGK